MESPYKIFVVGVSLFVLIPLVVAVLFIRHDYVKQKSITLYADSGEVIKKWRGNCIEVDDDYVSFVDTNGQRVRVSGTVSVEP